MARWSNNPFYSELSNTLKSFGQIILYLRFENMSFTTLFLVIGRLATKLVVCTTFIDEHTLAILTGRPKATAGDSSPTAIMEQVNTPGNTVLNTKHSEAKTNNTLHETINISRRVEIRSTIVRVTKQNMRIPSCVTLLAASTRAQGFLHFYPNFEPATQRCPSAEGGSKALPNRPFYVWSVENYAGHKTWTNTNS